MSENLCRLGSAVERVAIAMWADYVRTASPPVMWHKDHDLKHWAVTATQKDREAWRRSAAIAIEAINRISIEMDIARPLLPPDWRKLVYAVDIDCDHI